MASETPQFFPYADRFPLNRGDLLETSQINTIGSIVRLASLGLGTSFGLQRHTDRRLWLGSRYFV